MVWDDRSPRVAPARSRWVVKPERSYLPIRGCTPIAQAGAVGRRFVGALRLPAYARRMSDGWTIASSLSGAAAAIAAAWAGWSAARATKQTAAVVKIEQERRAEELADRVEAAEAARRALIIVGTEKTNASASGESYVATFYNEGPSWARSVTFALHSNETGKAAPHVNRGDSAPPFALAPHERREFGYSQNFGGASHFVCRLEWTDDAGAHLEDRDLELPSR